MRIESPAPGDEPGSYGKSLVVMRDGRRRPGLAINRRPESVQGQDCTESDREPFEWIADVVIRHGVVREEGFPAEPNLR